MDNKIYECKQCHRTSKNRMKDGLCKHCRIKTWTCNKCGQEYRAINELEICNKCKNAGKIFVCDICSREFNSKKSLANHKKYHDDDFRKEMSDKQKGRTFSEEARRKMSISATGKKLSETHKANIGKAVKIRWQSEEFRKQYHENNIGRIESEEQKAKLSEKALKRWADPEFKQAMTDKIRIYTPIAMKQESVRKKISIAAKRKWSDPEFAIKQMQLLHNASNNPESRAKQKATFKRTVNSIEHKTKMYKSKGYSDSQIAFFIDDEYAKSFIENSKTETYAGFMKELGVYSEQVYRRCYYLGYRDKFNHQCNHSNEEIEVKDFVNTFDKDAACNRKVLNGREIDIYSEKHEFGIEFDGLYWHSEKNCGKAYGLKKTIDCEKKNIRLMHIYENEWWYKQDIIKSIISAAFNKNEKIYARKCSIVDLSNADTKAFLDANHLQGHVNSQFAAGLIYDNELVSVMTFGKPRFNNFDGLEMLRFASKLNMTVVGGESKLFKYLVNKHDMKSVISYCNRSKFSGNGYSKLDFKHVRDTQPSYIWFKGGNIKSRFSTQMKNEFEIMTKKGYERIFDCGNSVWEWHSKS